MIRRLLSLLAGAALAVGLFWCLALLVTPPDQPFEEPEITMSMNMVEAPEIAPEPESPAPAEAPPPTAAQPPPMPTPEPLASADSAIALPEVELPDEPVEPVELDSDLPELTEITPEPVPEPTPEPEPEPTPQPAPQPAPTPSPQPAPSPSPSPTPAQSAPAPAPQAPVSNEPVSVGQIAATSKTDPVYPNRALRRNMEGFVEVSFVIRRDGSVDAGSIQVINAQPRRVFEDSARDAIASWQFPPSQQLRRATQRIDFQLR
ncbi:energy transducer TonB [Halomonas sp. GD1P12]|uniref:energy transducer TonB n=1 Tax=Halomonas sp. GD1P12 TaxID=2982691 RepID=UPI0021E4D7F4|nr:energy transducer TonB [Halomonas sp. GD1P12]UYG01453.1 TonB family protein [Halomonas sp. GD1P12]